MRRGNRSDSDYARLERVRIEGSPQSSSVILCKGGSFGHASDRESVCHFVRRVRLRVRPGSALLRHTGTPKPLSPIARRLRCNHFDLLVGNRLRRSPRRPMGRPLGSPKPDRGVRHALRTGSYWRYSSVSIGMGIHSCCEILVRDGNWRLYGRLPSLSC